MDDVRVWQETLQREVVRIDAGGFPLALDIEEAELLLAKLALVLDKVVCAPEYDGLLSPADGIFQLKPVRFKYNALAREGYIVGLHPPGLAAHGQLPLVEVFEVYNSRDGAHDGPRFKRFHVEKVESIVRPA